MMSHDRTLFGESFDMFRLLLHVTQRNEEREVSVAMTGGLEHGVERPLHLFPDAVTPGLDHHASANLTRLRQITRSDDLLVPFGKIFLPTRADCEFCGFSFCHKEAGYLNPGSAIGQWRLT